MVSEQDKAILQALIDEKDAYIKRLEAAYLASKTRWNKEHGAWFPDSETYEEFQASAEKYAYESLEEIRKAPPCK
jgi:hypothetical protein